MNKQQSEQKRLASPCATCPFLVENYNKPNPEGYDPHQAAEQYDDKVFHDWFSESNLRRLWKDGISKGEVLLCHSTDPNAHEYGGKNAKPGTERLCVGSLAIVFKHLKAFQTVAQAGAKNPISAYRKQAGKYPMTRDGMYTWVMMIQLGMTALMGGLHVPNSLSAEDVRRCALPWPDSFDDETEE